MHICTPTSLRKGPALNLSEFRCSYKGRAPALRAVANPAEPPARGYPSRGMPRAPDGPRGARRPPHNRPPHTPIHVPERSTSRELRLDAPGIDAALVRAAREGIHGHRRAHDPPLSACRNVPGAGNGVGPIDRRRVEPLIADVQIPPAYVNLTADGRDLRAEVRDRDPSEGMSRARLRMGRADVDRM